MSDRKPIPLTPELLLRAYAIGIFPMAESRFATDLHWVEPTRRGILPLDSFHIPHKLKKLVRKDHFEVTCDLSFVDVIDGCAEGSDDRRDTWINETIRALYIELHAMGHAHSIECWHEGCLAGGLYGVALGGAFFGESMFSRESGASKVALVHLVARLRLGGYKLLDTQFVTSHLRQFGAKEISREAYRSQLSKVVGLPVQFPVELPSTALEDFLQSSNQTS
ncbi:MULTISPECIES: leucyl/phenylalanyl-tRNA--protein transferase [Limibacillus]|uniref:Leucyl/phenylalanyl-tRNA--protein transferase n=1 Tax=Limibacillus halophilus TaxID=1579333 RepID=A0A839SQ90_9PROT|nr:leucyl/phenylalanyl-tRNA--protein transferase [Limibacillus halophilus]MBB3065067.1 leucyl/phenylalanyl-tRNA--protein transferase [Limibacillus halophilus]